MFRTATIHARRLAARAHYHQQRQSLYTSSNRETITLIASPLITYALFWLVLMVLGIVNGVLRVMTYGRHMDELRAHQLSTLTGMVAMTMAVWLLSLFVLPTSMEMALLIGVLWLALTVAFEFGFGHFVARHSWERLVADYNIRKGRLWPLFLLWILLLPSLVYLAT